ncbi:MAG: ADP-ribosylglycohydrolase family protein [Muribaculaceae bacterium]|nr:ADP-ribosylglycohydrolase family protein [Muribaculaceae bacterium]
MTHNSTLDRLRGSIIAGAIGDALGNPVEFMSYPSILSTYGRQGITHFDSRPHYTDAAGKAVFTDDTQMTLFTAEGLLNVEREDISPIECIEEAYLEWFGTQTGQKSAEHHHGTLRDIAALNVRRAPGNTCLSALDSLWRGQQPTNHSKGCGGVMRVAPIALWAASGHLSVESAVLLGGDAAALTHKHPLGFLPAALITAVIYYLAIDEHPTREHLVDYIRQGEELLTEVYSDLRQEVKSMNRLSELAIELAGNALPDIDNITRLGEGWVGDEALAIALYCAVRHFGNLHQALIAAVNHNGDSDSTGAVTGNILGAAVGYEAIPQHLKDGIEQRELLLTMADKLG